MTPLRNEGSDHAHRKDHSMNAAVGKKLVEPMVEGQKEGLD